MKFRSTISYMQECISILFNAANGIYDFVQMLPAGSLPEDCRADLELLSKVQREAVDGLSKENMEFYFKSLDGGQTCAASLIGCLPSPCSSDQLEKEEDFFDTLTLAERLDVKCNNTEASLEQKLADYAEYMETLQVEDEIRWRIFSALLHPQEHKEKIFSLLRHVWGNLSRHTAELEEIFQRHRAEVVEYDKKNPVEFTFMKQSSYQLSREVFPDEITVTLYDPFFLRAWIRSHWNNYFIIGAFFPYRPIPVSRKKMEKKDVMIYGKVLADGNKLEILRLLSHRTYINKELADALKLSTATISYHMSVLTELELVSTTISANKIIYELNQDKIEEIMERLTDYFDHLEQQ